MSKMNIQCRIMKMLDFTKFLLIFFVLLHLYYILITKCNTVILTYLFPFAKLPPTLFPSSCNSIVISLVVIILFLSVVAIFSATTNGSIKSIKILAGDEAKLAP